MAEQLKVLHTEQMRDIAFAAGKIVVEADDIMPLVDKAIAQVRPEETGPTGDKDAE